MLSFTNTQMLAFENSCFCRLSIEYIHQELEYFDLEVPTPELERQFNHLANLFNVQLQVERNIIILLMIANNVFPDVFTKQWIDSFISEVESESAHSGDLSYERENILQQLLHDQGYSSESLKQKTWM